MTNRRVAWKRELGRLQRELLPGRSSGVNAALRALAIRHWEFFRRLPFIIGRLVWPITLGEEPPGFTRR